MDRVDALRACFHCQRFFILPAQRGCGPVFQNTNLNNMKVFYGLSLIKLRLDGIESYHVTDCCSRVVSLGRALKCGRIYAFLDLEFQDCRVLYELVKSP